MTAVSDRPEPSRLTVAPDLLRRHAETVSAAIAGEADGLEVETISHSWRRSAEIYRIDADSHEAPHVLTDSALRLSKEPIECVVRAAQPELDRLHRIVRHAGYVTLLCNTEGVMVDDRGSEERSAELRHWGIWVGGVWSEAAEGTNGIGTCIADHRAVTVHQTQHFRSRHIGLSCSGAPVFEDQRGGPAIIGVVSWSTGANGSDGCDLFAAACRVYPLAGFVYDLISNAEGLAQSLRLAVGNRQLHAI